ncbi:conserved hypothetical protein [Frankia canadensis]|uniref:Uncharacterized protein n=1 Tax=Frankia canadensis TaxID=1836972 RepID=A0A2I2KIM9_9ACTN|nr:hypothetical protein [Frankia canadensis]SNQ45516.1 conserved hypothetical protein [Frankia canadensis]SOU52806.1 conserved hypothetical protein [Frankia canadensis]
MTRHRGMASVAWRLAIRCVLGAFVGNAIVRIFDALGGPFDAVVARVIVITFGVVCGLTMVAAGDYARRPPDTAGDVEHG